MRNYLSDDHWNDFIQYNFHFYKILQEFFFSLKLVQTMKVLESFILPNAYK